MSSRGIINFVVLGLVLWATGVHAAALQNLYEEQLPVATQSSETLRRGAGEALEKVLVRVSGRRDVADNARIAEALANAEPLLTQYRYHRKLDEEGEEQLSLQVSFSPRQVNSLLQSAGLPVWSANRPSVLVWLVEDTADGRRFVDSDAESVLYSSLQEEAARRGLSLQFPLLDLVDAGNLAVEDVWQMRLDDARDASARYGAAYTLVGRASELSSGRWVASWNILQGDEELRLDSEGSDGREAVAPLVDTLADIQAREFSVLAGSDSGSTLIYVGDIRSFSSYARLVTYLENLSVVQHANTVWLSEDALVIDLLLNGDMEKVQRFLTMDNQLHSLREAPQVDPEVARMPIRSYYSWRGY